MNDSNEPTYIEVVCETKLNPTENISLLKQILQTFLEGEVITDERFDGVYLVIRNSGWNAFERLKAQIKSAKLLDTTRRRLLRSSVGNLTALYFNKQAAAMNRLAIVDVNDGPPLGFIAYQIISDNLEYVINKFTPKTHEGRELSEEEWSIVNARKKRKNSKASS